MAIAEHYPNYADFLQILRRSTDLLREDSVREEFFSVERLEQYASYLARELSVTRTPKRGRFILPELKENGRQLVSAYQRLTEAIRGKQMVSPAAEWFVDNFHIVEDQLREIKQDLPRDYYDELPKLASGELAGYPRVYAIALAIIAHTDSRLDAETLKRFVRSFQVNAPLSIGELWAIAITLRIALVEHLKPLALSIVSAREKRAEADALADTLLKLAVRSDVKPDSLLKLLRSKVGDATEFDRAFVVQLTQRLRDQDPDVMPAFDWLEQQLEIHHKTTTQQVTQLEHHRQATTQVTVGNIISSMRLLSALDWREFVESVSLVDPVLNKDPAGAYSKMDFGTRDRYRHVVERLAKRSKLSEVEVVEKVVETAQAALSREPGNLRRSHVGYYLIGEGRFEFAKSISYRPRLRDRLHRWLLQHPTSIYLGSLVTLTLCFLVPTFEYFTIAEGHVYAGLFFCLLALVPASEFALSILNHNIDILIKPKPLPKLDTEKGIPQDATTMVVIPTLLTKESVVRDLIEKIQVHFLANQDPNIYFALLGDFSDSDQEEMPGDVALLQIARKGIDELNEEYGDEAHPRFYLFHRRREFNPSEGKWMGVERKRGKLQEFNRLIRGATDTTYLEPTADPHFLSKIRYVITLDSDTQLPRGSAHKLIGTILHPLNRPSFDSKKGRVTSGYGILQPRISVALVSANRSRFARLFSGSTGLDPYTTACSDVYQDLFGEGSYTGKGLYVVDAFEESLEGRVPQNTLLSHDLFEGCFARSALVSDVELFDDYPLDYETYSKRQHRWIRGDWQISPWLLPRVPNAKGDWVPNPFSIISRWKIWDNLRRSMVPTTVILWLFLAWTFLPGSSLIWTLMIVILFVFPIYATVTNNLFHHRQGVTWRGHVSRSWEQTTTQTQQVFLMLAFLAEQAWNQSDAIGRALYRMFISRKKMLEWVSFAEAQGNRVQPKNTNVSLRYTIGPGPVIGITFAILIALRRPEAFLVASPFLIAWIANPFLKSWIKQKARKRERPLVASEVATYRLYARRTWLFFETFVTKEENYLAPDNFQEEPRPVVAHRTSPTNIGLQLLSMGSAYDLGYIGLLELLERSERTFKTLEKLERMHGHFFNWYDTQTLEPLRPQYISTVDSGNLAGHLLAMKHCLLDLGNSLPTNSRAKQGLIDTLSLLKLEADRVARVSPTLGLNLGVVTVKQFQDATRSILEFVEVYQWDSLGGFDGFLSSLKGMLAEAEDILSALVTETSADVFRDTRVWLTAALHQSEQFQRDLSVLAPWAPDAEKNATDFRQRQLALVEKCDEIAMGMDFKFLFDEQRKIFVIGYNVADGRKDNSYYDLLASESRLASFVAIAKGDVPQEHWFRLGRQMTAVKGSRALISWTATMFEYLMPLLVMRRYSETLLDQTYLSVVARQIEYGADRGVPWGISEAGYNARDLHLIYQYGPFGVPGLGLKRGLSDDLVVSPYSTMLASVIDPLAALSNLRSLEEKGALSRYGFFESIDYTPERLQKNQKSFILRSFMSHHQGMSLVSLNNLLNGHIMQRRFHNDPLVQATQLLLQERTPLTVYLSRPRAEEVHFHGNRLSSDWKPRTFFHVDLPTPRTELLSNGNYSVMVTTAGSGYSRSGPFAVNRWREDVTRDHWGQFFYIRNRATGRIWSTGYQPTGFLPKKYEATFAEDKVEFWRRDGMTSTHTEIIVSQEDDVELRRISLTNNFTETRDFEITSFMEVVLAKPEDDVAHPAFSNLFVQTEYSPAECALLATRRRRSETEQPIWGFHGLVTEGEAIGSVQYETDRSRFLGRGRTPADAFAITEGRPLSDTVGPVLDPIFSLRLTVRIPPKETVRLVYATGVARTRDDALKLAEKYHDIHIFTREAELAWTKSRVQLRHLNIGSKEAHTFQRLAGRVIYCDSSLRPRSHVLSANTKTQSGLWAYGISGDLPIIVVRISEEKDMKMVRELLHAHEYLRLKGLAIDLVLLNEHSSSYLQQLQDELQKQIRMSGSYLLLDKPGGVFVRRSDLMPKEDITLLRTVARVDLDSEKGTLEEQLKRRPAEDELPELLVPSKTKRRTAEQTTRIPPLEFFNGLGGFTKGGRHYVTVLKDGQWTPAPWINVIANERDFGFIISESGSGYVWSVNSRENRLTPWSNDGVSDPVGEALYLRDEETAEVWSPTPLPIREKEAYVITHGQGYTQFEHASHGISTELQMFVPTDAPVKVSYLRIKNTSDVTRKVSVTYYVEWVLGVHRPISAPHVITTQDPDTGMLYARNPYNNEFKQRVAFTYLSTEIDSFTCDRKAFLGRNGSAAKPAGLGREKLSGLAGAGLDPCAVLQSKLELAPGEEREVILLLGQTVEVEEARALTRRFGRIENVLTSFKQVLASWEKILGTIEIKTPDAAMNLLVNRWLLYQTLSCRIWARSAFYQSGGAYGFRDQLQDVMAMVYTRPEIARAQILRSAGRQFVEGDVQHWWHPPTGRGVRTHFSDDLIWLPFVTSFYVNVTGDRSILSEIIPFIEAPPVDPSQDSDYREPTLSKQTATLIDHCARTLDRSLKTGTHGLPLMGTGDWNDGMNRVGAGGKGESVWVGWFLYATMKEFIPLLSDKTDSNRIETYRDHMTTLKKAIEENAWDGDWYRRAYFDDGTPLGSSSNSECRIDSIAQSWAVLSGAANPQRAVQAMDAVDEYLINRGDGLVKLFTPPFDSGSVDPGYIKGYVPGVRENGGQYTHAAIWTLMAFAALGDGDRAGELYALLNPINHSATRAGLHKYKVEPYVAAADIYGMFPHVGRGGWTWYTGSASWMYRAALESILGFTLRADRLRITPCIPKLWQGFEINYKYKSSQYLIVVTNRQDRQDIPANSGTVEVDGTLLPSSEITLVDDGKTHKVRVVL